MKFFVLQAAIAFLAVLILMAVVFRSVWARDLLRFARNLLWVYVAVIVILAAVRLWQGGL